MVRKERIWDRDMRERANSVQEDPVSRVTVAPRLTKGPVVVTAGIDQVGV